MTMPTIANLTDLVQQNFDLGKSLLEKKEFFKANLHFTKALTIGELLEDSQIIIQAQLQIADVLFRSNSLRSAYYFYEDLLEDEDSLNYDDYCYALNRLGVINARMGRYNEAQKIFQRLATKDNIIAKRRAFVNMGVTYYYLALFFEKDCMDKAIQSFTQAYEYCTDQEEDLLIKHRILRNIGMALYEIGDYYSALKKLKESLLLIDDKAELARTLNEIAKVHIGLNEYSEALQELREAEKILLKKDSRNLEELSRNIYIHGLLSKKRGRIESAFSQFRTALQGFVESETYPEAVLVCREIYDMYQMTNNERANFYLDQYQFFLNYLDPMVL